MLPAILKGCGSIGSILILASAVSAAFPGVDRGMFPCQASPPVASIATCATCAAWKLFKERWKSP